MIQFNLLPSVKVEYIKARRQKRMVILSAAGTIAVCLSILGILFSIVFIGQKVRLSSLDKSINENAAKLKAKPNIDKVLTIQNQLNAIDALHESKPEIGRVFTYITQVTPSSISIQTYSIDFAEPKMTISGQAPSLEEVNKFVDTLKFTTIGRQESAEAEVVVDESTKPFDQVVLSSFARDDKSATYTITLSYDPLIFSSSEVSLKLVVPKITTTRSETERPADLFQQNQPPAGGN